MMNKTFSCIFAVICILSILEVTTFNAKEFQDDNIYDEFDEFDGEESINKYEKNLQYNLEKQHSNKENNNKEFEIRQPSDEKSSATFKMPLNLPPLRFSFCVSCGYRQAFDQLAQVVRQKYAGILIEGSNYPPTQIKAFIAQFIGFAKIALIIIIVLGRDPFISLGITTPQFFLWMINNKLSSCLMLFMLSNSIEGMLMSTGAFEIYIGQERIWSKLESGRPPSPGELIQAIDSYLAIKGDKLTSSSFGFELNN